MKKYAWITGCLFVVASAMVPHVSAASSPKDKPKAIDFTQGARPDKNQHDWNLGATGLRGYMWGWRNHTTDARQILITKVDPGSPADGTLQVDDVILGVNGQKFSSDARIAFGKALTKIESARTQGALRLKVWRKGKTSDKTISLKGLGAYAATAPFACAKSKAIFKQGCEAIAKRGLNKMSIDNDMNALALLASGDPKYKPLLQNYVKIIDKQLQKQWWWHFGYANLFLAEYVYATKDPYAMKVLTEKSKEIAKFQSPVGTWGHEHKLTNGLLHGYGAMNQVGLILNMSLVVAQKAGVSDPIVVAASAKSAAQMRWYVGKGSLPYGDHQPWMDHEDNGKNSMGTILYDLLGDREAATFFTRMSVAAHAERENGHTGNWFNVTFALMGVSRGGPNATGGYMKEQAWYYDSARKWDGSFVHQGIAGSRPDSYRNWDCTGAYLLGFATATKTLLITGKQPSSVKPFSKSQTASLIEDGRHFTFWDRGTSYDHFSDAELIKRLSSWSPIVRVRAASSLKNHGGDYNAQLNKLLRGSNVYGKYGAAQAVIHLGEKASGTATALMAQLTSDDPWLLSESVEALAMLDLPTRKKATPAVLKLAVRKLKADPRGMAQRATAVFLFSRKRGGGEGVFQKTLEYHDQKALVAAIAAIVANNDGRTREVIANVTRQLKDDKALAPLLPALMEATRHSSPSGIMFADNIRMAGIELLAKSRIREGMQMCIDQMDPPRWGSDRRIPKCLNALKSYGGNAKSLLPQIKAVHEQFRKRRSDPKKKERLLKLFDDAIAHIQNDKNPPKLRSARSVNPAAK